MRKQTVKRLAKVVLVAFAFTCMPISAMAATTKTLDSAVANIVGEAKNQTRLTAQQVQALALVYSPTSEQYELNLKSLDLSQTVMSNNINTKSASINGYQATSADMTNVNAIQAKIDEYKASLADPANPTLSEQAILEMYNSQLQSARQSATSAVDSSANSINSQISQINSLEKQQDTLDDNMDDLKKTISDWEKQVKLIALVLCMQVTTSEKTIEQLELQIEMQEQALKLAKVQESLGMTLTVNVQSAETMLKDYQRSLTTSKDSLSNLKRQINVLIGRAQGSPLEIVPVTVPQIVSVIPTYSDALIKEVQNNNYTLKTYQRSIDNYKDDVKDVTDSDTLQEADYNIAGVNLKIDEKKRSLANDLKTKIANLTSDKIAYENGQQKVATARKNLEVAQKKYELGMIKKSELLQQQYNYNAAINTDLQNKYNYYLDWQEYNALIAGTDMSSYSSYRR